MPMLRQSMTEAPIRIVRVRAASPINRDPRLTASYWRMSWLSPTGSLWERLFSQVRIANALGLILGCVGCLAVPGVAGMSVGSETGESPWHIPCVGTCSPP